MKRILIALATVCAAPFPTFAKNECLPDATWKAAAVQQIHELAYGFRQSAKPAIFTAANDQHEFHSRIMPSGYSVQQMATSLSAPWSANFELSEIAGMRPHFSRVQQEGNARLVYHYRNAAVRYTNTDLGLRQDFIVPTKPANNAPLQVRFAVRSTLHPKLSAAQQLLLADASEQTQIVYDDLHVWDATNRVLPASFSIQGNEVTITVADEGAVYPVTIDPLTRRPEWNTTSTGLLTGILAGQLNSSLYGYSVAGIGDVDGDGYGDVAVGAPGLSRLLDGSVARVGAVFIFHGSATGLSTTPSNILQPSTAVAGALFGFSVDGEDMDGDGFSDLVVGAPVDQIAVSAGLGQTTASVGKVYTFSGANLNTNSNPSTFLSVSLSTSALDLTNVSVKALFGFSVAVTDDLNGDGRKDFIVGAPGLKLPLGGVKVGGAYVFTSTGATAYNAPIELNGPTLSTALGPISVGDALFGYSVDGVGDYNGDGRPDVVVGAPGGDLLGTLTGLLGGQILTGRALVYYGTASGVNSNPGKQLYAAASGLLNTTTNFFGFSVKGIRSTAGARNGSIAVGAPLAGTLSNALSLSIKTGSVHIFKPVTGAATTAFPFQTLESPASSSLLSVLNNYNMNVLMGSSIDNMFDANGDSYPDLIVGEPLSTGTNLLGGLQAAATGGHAYVYAGRSDGGFEPVPIFQVNAAYGSSFLSANAAPLFAFSVAGVRNAYGPATRSRVVVGSPAGGLDFSGLLNIGNTVGTLLNFAAGDNGPGAAYSFDPGNNTPLPVVLLSFRGTTGPKGNELSWKVASNKDFSNLLLQRSADGKNWTLLSEVPVNPEENKRDYSVLDAQPFSGVSYYRLKLSSAGEQETYSNVVALSNSTTSAAQLQAFPNPVIDRLYIQAASDQEETLRIISQAGTLVGTVHLPAGQGVTSFSKEAIGLSVPGTYTLQWVRKDGSPALSRTLIVAP